MSPATRTAYRGLTAAVTGVATFGALASTGWFAGVWARDYQHQQADTARARARAQEARSRWFAAHPVRNVVEKRRPHKTIFRTIRVPAQPVVVEPGPGGAVISRSSGTSPGSHVAAGSSGHSTKPPTPHPAATTPATSSSPPVTLPPPPPPVPSSGS